MITELKDAEGTPRNLRWGAWHCNCLEKAMATEGYFDTYIGFPNQTYTFRDTHVFRDKSDGEIFIVNPGDTYAAWRD